MNDALRRRAWDKGCTDIMYLTIEYPNYPIISLLTQPRGNCVNVLPSRNSSFHFGTWIRILTTATQCVTIELRRPNIHSTPNAIKNMIFQIFNLKKTKLLNYRVKVIEYNCHFSKLFLPLYIQVIFLINIFTRES